MTAVIRPAEVTDLPGVYRAWQQMREHNASQDPRIHLIPVSEAEFAVAGRETIERPTSAALVAELNGEVVGFVTGAIEANQPDRLPERHVTVGYLYVDPSARRQGIARGLVRELQAWAAKQDGIEHIEMTVLANDRDAANFWGAVGFTPFIQRLWLPLDDRDVAR